MGELENKLETLLEGEDLDTVIHVLAFALADSVAFATDYVFDEGNNATIATMAQSAYAHICADNSDTLQ